MRSRIPLVVNGDITSFEKAVAALEMSGADAVMIGRGAQGQPWLPGQIGRRLETGIAEAAPTLARAAATTSARSMTTSAATTACASACAMRASISAGRSTSPPDCSRAPAATLKAWRQKILTSDDPHRRAPLARRMHSTILHGVLLHDFRRRTSPAGAVATARPSSTPCPIRCC